MMASLLSIKNLSAGIEEKEILHDISLDINEGETHIILGPNGAGKSTLGAVIMGSPEYEVTSGSIIWNGEDITEEGPDKRRKKGIFMTFQDPVEIPGISLSSFLRSRTEQVSGERIRLWNFRKMLNEAMTDLGMDPSYADRDLNVGFSGGEKKKAEILQMLMLRPKLAILDETDSGLDVDAVRIVARGIKAYKEIVGGTLMIITHNTRLVEALDIDAVHVLAGGKLAAQGNRSLLERIDREGFEGVIGEENE